MSVFRVTQDPSSGYGYIFLADIEPGGVAGSIELAAEDPSDPDALDSIVLDFGHDGRLVGIEIQGRAERVLRPELLARARPPKP